LTWPEYAELSILLSQVVQQGGKHKTQIVADSTERGWLQRIHTSKKIMWVLDLIVNVNYLDKIRSFWSVFVRMFSMLKMLFCCNTNVKQNFVSFTFYDLWLNANWEKIFSLCFCMHLYGWLQSVAWKGVLLVTQKKLSYGFMSPITYYNNQHHNHVLNYTSVQNLAQT